MTKAQIWTAAFLITFMALFGLQRLTDNGEHKGMHMPGMGGGMPAPQGAAEVADASGEQLAKNWGCGTCHGADLAGTKMAPPLRGLASAYSRDALINYLRNPSAYMDSDRFRDYKEKYRNIVMPAYGNKDVKELGKLADYLLGLQ